MSEQETGSGMHRNSIVFHRFLPYVFNMSNCLVNEFIQSELFVEDPPPEPPTYPPRWTATAHFQFINMTNNSSAGSGILYQITDSINQKFRTDDLYFAGTFSSPYDTLFASSVPDNMYQY